MKDTFDLILILEVVLPFFVATVALSIVVFRRKTQDRSALQQLINKYKENEKGRKESIFKFLKNKVGLGEQEIEETSKKLLLARKSILQKIISAFLTRKAESIANLDNELSIITSAYHELSVSLPADNASDEDEMTTDVSETVVTQNNPELEKELKNLKEEKKNLEVELKITLSTLNSIFEEYTSMFGEESDKKDMSVGDILSAMEFFGQDQVDTASESDNSFDAFDNVSPEESEAISEEPSVELFKEPEAVIGESVTKPAREDEAEPGWDEAFKETEEPKPTTEEPVTEPVGETEAEPSWDEAFAETEEPKATIDEHLTEPTAETEKEKLLEDGWGDDNDEMEILDDGLLDDIQPEWGNAVKDELYDPEDKKK